MSLNKKAPLEDIWETYQFTRDSFKITLKALKQKENETLLNKTQFQSSSSEKSIGQIKKSRENSEKFVVLALWATFERVLIEYLQEKGKSIRNRKPKPFSEKFHEKVEAELEYWNIEDILDLFKSIVDPTLIGDSKNIKKYRDYIAHQNPKKVPPSEITPVFAHQILSEIIRQIQNS